MPQAVQKVYRCHERPGAQEDMSHYLLISTATSQQVNRGVLIHVWTDRRSFGPGVTCGPRVPVGSGSPGYLNMGSQNALDTSTWPHVAQLGPQVPPHGPSRPLLGPKSRPGGLPEAFLSTSGGFLEALKPRKIQGNTTCFTQFRACRRFCS